MSNFIVYKLEGVFGAVFLAISLHFSDHGLVLACKCVGNLLFVDLFLPSLRSLRPPVNLGPSRIVRIQQLDSEIPLSNLRDT